MWDEKLPFAGYLRRRRASSEEARLWRTRRSLGEGGQLESWKHTPEFFDIVWDDSDFARSASYVETGLEAGLAEAARPRRRKPQAAHIEFPGGHRRGVTPVPIPNTEVKLSTADGTACVSAWESRSLPGLFLQKPDAGFKHRAFAF